MFDGLLPAIQLFCPYCFPAYLHIFHRYIDGKFQQIAYREQRVLLSYSIHEKAYLVFCALILLGPKTLEFAAIQQHYAEQNLSYQYGISG